MSMKTVNNQIFNQTTSESASNYAAWKQSKLDEYNNVLIAPVIRLDSLSNPGDSALLELAKRCRLTNLALYETAEPSRSTDQIRTDLLSFSDKLGLRIAEQHRSAGDHGIVALRVTDAARQRGYIPYSRKPMNWHTDGYYNTPENQIRAMVLHCVTPADDGGVNQFMDPEIVYMRLRDENPAYIDALMHPKAMCIPKNVETDGSVRPVSIGPVFSVDKTGKLIMRYTARTRSIQWRDDPMTIRATDALTEILANDDPLMLTARLKAGQGILCNNVLHNRTGFDPNTETKSSRMIYRIRFHNRVKGS